MYVTVQILSIYDYLRIKVLFIQIFYSVLFSDLAYFVSHLIERTLHKITMCGLTLRHICFDLDCMCKQILNEIVRGVAFKVQTYMYVNTHMLYGINMSVSMNA